jgi:hypothetical protein
VLPCGGHAWPGPFAGKSKTAPVIRLPRGQLSVRPILWEWGTGQKPTKAVYSLHDPPCCEHLTLNKTEAGQVVEAPPDSPDPTPAGTPAVDEQTPGQTEAEVQPEVHDRLEDADPALNFDEALTRAVEPLNPVEPGDAPVGGGSEGSAGSTRVGWCLVERRRRGWSRRRVVFVVVVGLVGLLHPWACGVVGREAGPVVEMGPREEETTTTTPTTAEVTVAPTTTTTQPTTTTERRPCVPGDCLVLDD